MREDRSRASRQPLRVALHPSCNIRKLDVTPGGTKRCQIRLGVALVFADQSLREGHVLDEPPRDLLLETEWRLPTKHPRCVDGRVSHIVERLRSAGADIENPAPLRISQEP